MGATKIIIIVVLIIGIIAFSVYFLLMPRIQSVNIINSIYEEPDNSLSKECDTCLQTPNNPAACVGPGIKTIFNLQIKNSPTAHCKVVSGGVDLTNSFSADKGQNEIQDAYGEQLKQQYKIKVCCSIKQDLSNSVCSSEKVLEARC